MTLRTLIRRSLRFHWRSHLGVVIGAAIGSAALIGALIVGDSVKGSLREQNLSRIGNGSWLLYSSDRFFTEQFPLRVRCQANLMALTGAARRYQNKSTELPTCINPNLPERTMLLLPGTATRGDASQRVNEVQIVGISDFAPVLLPAAEVLLQRPRRVIALTNEVVVNSTLAKRLGVKAGETVLLRFAKPGQMSADHAVAARNQADGTLRLVVRSVATNGEIANFLPHAGAVTPANVFVPLTELARVAGLQQVHEVSYSIAKDDPNDGDDEISSTATEERKERVEINRVNAWLSPEVVQLLPTSDFKRGTFWSALDRWLGWAGSRLGLNKGVEATQTRPLQTGKQAIVLTDLLRQSWDLDSLQIAELTNKSGHLSLHSPRVFLDPPLVRSALAADTNAQPILTYLANLITVGSNATPYSMVTAAGAPWAPAGLRDDEIVLNQWLADDLQAKPGDALTLVYFDPESGARLTERTNTFRVHSIVPMQMPWADRTLMPQFPGIEKAETTAEWDTAFPLVHKIRPQDDDYWRDHRGTPKAFVTLAAGQKMWANRFGNLTAIRFPIPTNYVAAEVTRLHNLDEANTAESNLSLVTSAATNSADAFRAALEKKILATLKPEELGLRFEPVREQALKAAEQSQDFGGLFIGFSLFVIVAALLLMAMLFQFSLEQRAAEIGTMLALGFTPKQVRRLFLREGAALAFIGGILGTLGGIGYARAMLHGLTTIWRDAVGASSLKFFVTPQSLLVGLFAATLVAVVTLWFALRKQARQPARVLLAGALECGDLSPLVARQVAPQKGCAKSPHSKVGWVSLIVALGLVGWTLAKGDTANAGAFFGAGALVLIAGLALVNSRLAGLKGSADSLVRENTSPQDSRTRLSALRAPSLATLALRGLTRRRSRSVATAAMLASGTFLIVSIGVFRLDANRDATQRSSGTGGFALIGESTMPVVADLNTKAGRETFALNEADFADVHFVQFRVRAGDEASCLNLNRAQKPRLLGVRTNVLTGRFTFAKLIADASVKTSEWSFLSKTSVPDRAPVEPGEIPAIGDAASIQWAMGKKVGDTLDYVDERGQPFKVRIVGAVANSILQGQLIIDEAEFVKRFPSESGYKYFLIDAPTNRVADVSGKLSRALQDAGLELTPAPNRLAQFNAVQNTYLGTFQILGGLGLLLGSAGLGVVVLRNVLERRGELAVLLAVGWLRQQVRRLVLVEHAALLGVGLALGIAAAFVAVLPSLLVPGGEFPWLTLGLTLAAVLANGVLWTWLATRVALRGELLAALRGE